MAQMAKRNDPPIKKAKELQARLQAERRELADIEGESQFHGQANVARAQAKKNIKALEDSIKSLKYKSPDRYNDTALTLEVPRLEYHAQQENIGVQTPKKAGGIPAKVEQHSGLENMRANEQTKRAQETRAMSSSPKSKVPGAVDKYDEMGF
jgi:hypothetical protein